MTAVDERRGPTPTSGPCTLDVVAAGGAARRRGPRRRSPCTSTAPTRPSRRSTTDVADPRPCPRTSTPTRCVSRRSLPRSTPAGAPRSRPTSTPSRRPTGGASPRSARSPCACSRPGPARWSCTGRRPAAAVARVTSRRLDGVGTQHLALPLTSFVDGGWYWFDLVAGTRGARARRGGVVRPGRHDRSRRVTGAADHHRHHHLRPARLLRGPAHPARPGPRAGRHRRRGARRRPGHPAGHRRPRLRRRPRGARRPAARHPAAQPRRLRRLLPRHARDARRGPLGPRAAPGRRRRRASPRASPGRSRSRDTAARPTIVGGHMFSMHERSVLHAFAEVVRPVAVPLGAGRAVGARPRLRRAGTCGRRRGCTAASTSTTTAGGCASIPTAVLRDVGLSLPFFIKWDDAEYGLRASRGRLPHGDAARRRGLARAVDRQGRQHRLAGLLPRPQPAGRGPAALALRPRAAGWSARAWRSRSSTCWPCSTPRPRCGCKAVAGRARRPGRPAPFAADSARRGARPAGRPRRCPDQTGRRRLRARAGRPPAQARARRRTPGRAAWRRCAPRHPASSHQVLPVPDGATDSPQREVASPDAGWWTLARLDSALVATADGTGLAWLRRDRSVAGSALADAVRAHRELLRRWPELSADLPRGGARHGGRAGLAPHPRVATRRGQRMTAPVDDGLVVQGLGGGLREVLARRHLLALLVRKELRVRYRASLLGLGWSYVKPAVQFVVYFVGLGLVLDQQRHRQLRRVPVRRPRRRHAPSARRSATRPARWWPTASSCARSSCPASCSRSRAPASPAVHLLPQVLVLLAGSLVAGWRPDAVGVAALVAGLALLAVLALGAGLLLSAVNVLFRDVENVVDLRRDGAGLDQPGALPVAAGGRPRRRLVAAHGLPAQPAHGRRRAGPPGHLGHDLAREPQRHAARSRLAHARRVRGRRRPGRRRAGTSSGPGRAASPRSCEPWSTPTPPSRSRVPRSTSGCGTRTASRRAWSGRRSAAPGTTTSSRSPPSTSRSPGASRSPCSGATAPGSRRCSSWSPGSWPPTPAGSACAAGWPGCSRWAPASTPTSPGGRTCTSTPRSSG